MKYNHDKAQEICNALGEKKQKDIYQLVVEGMKKSIILTEFILETGKEISELARNKSREELKKYIIIAAENIYKVLTEDKTMNDKLVIYNKTLGEVPDSQIFGMVLDNLYFALDNSQNDVIGAVQEVYNH